MKKIFILFLILSCSTLFAKEASIEVTDLHPFTSLVVYHNDVYITTLVPPYTAWIVKNCKENDTINLIGSGVGVNARHETFLVTKYVSSVSDGEVAIGSIMSLSERFPFFGSCLYFSIHRG